MIVAPKETKSTIEARRSFIFLTRGLQPAEENPENAPSLN